MGNTVFWDVTCNPEEIYIHPLLLYLEDGGNRSLQNAGIFYQTTQCHIPEDSNLVKMFSLEYWIVTWNAHQYTVHFNRTKEKAI
jgi:hypothetical protein